MTYLILMLLLLFPLQVNALTVNVVDQSGVNNCNNCELVAEGITPDGVGGLIIHVRSGVVIPKPEPPLPPPPPDPTCTLLPAAGIRNVAIWAYTSHCYYIVIPDTVASAGMYVTMGSMDWKTNQDLLIKKGTKPTKLDYDATYYPGAKGSGPVYWYLYTSESNETLMPSKVGPGTYYFYVYNRGGIHTETDITGKYELKASVYELATSPPRTR